MNISSFLMVGSVVFSVVAFSVGPHGGAPGGEKAVGAEIRTVHQVSPAVGKALGEDVRRRDPRWYCENGQIELPFLKNAKPEGGSSEERRADVEKIFLDFDNPQQFRMLDEAAREYRGTSDAAKPFQASMILCNDGTLQNSALAPVCGYFADFYLKARGEPLKDGGAACEVARAFAACGESEKRDAALGKCADADQKNLVAKTPQGELSREEALLLLGLSEKPEHRDLYARIVIQLKVLGLKEELSRYESFLDALTHGQGKGCGALALQDHLKSPAFVAELAKKSAFAAIAKKATLANHDRLLAQARGERAHELISVLFDPWKNNKSAELDLVRRTLPASVYKKLQNLEAIAGRLPKPAAEKFVQAPTLPGEVSRKAIQKVDSVERVDEMAASNAWHCPPPITAVQNARKALEENPALREEWERKSISPDDAVRGHLGRIAQAWQQGALSGDKLLRELVVAHQSGISQQTRSQTEALGLALTEGSPTHLVFQNYLRGGIHARGHVDDGYVSSILERALQRDPAQKDLSLRLWLAADARLREQTAHGFLGRDLDYIEQKVARFLSNGEANPEIARAVCTIATIGFADKLSDRDARFILSKLPVPQLLKLDDPRFDMVKVLIEARPQKTVIPALLDGLATSPHLQTPISKALEHFSKSWWETRDNDLNELAPKFVEVAVRGTEAQRNASSKFFLYVEPRGRDLAPFLKGTDEAEVKRALELLPLAKNSVAPAIPQLIRLVGDQTFRQEVLTTWHALQGNLRVDTQAQVAEITPYLQSTDKDQLSIALKVLGWADKLPPAIIPRVIELFESDAHAEDALPVLHLLAIDSKIPLAPLVSRLRALDPTKDAHQISGIAFLLDRMGYKDHQSIKDALPTILAGLQDPDAAASQYFLRALERFEALPASALPVLLKNAVTHPRGVAGLVKKMSPVPPSAVQEFLRIYKGAPTYRLAHLDHAVDLAPDDPEVIATLVAASKDPKAFPFQTWANVGPQAYAAGLPLVARALRETKVPGYIEKGIVFLEKAGKGNPEAQNTLMDLANNGDLGPVFRHSILAALQKIGVPENRRKEAQEKFNIKLPPR